MKDKVSIIMPTYKGKKMLEKSIQSILNQTYRNFELIIVDDNGLGSTYQKETEKIIRKFDDARIVYIPHEKNCNGACARNTGLKKAAGEYVCFHDDDDLMLEDRIEKCVRTMDEYSDVGGVLTNVLCCDEKMTPIRIITIKKDGDCTRELFTDGMFLGSGSNIFIRKKVANKLGGFDEAFARHQDVEYMIRFYKVAKTKKLGEISIIKSKNGIINIPNYPKFKRNEKLFIEKFKDDIDKLDKEDQDKFYSDVDYWIKISKALYDKKISSFSKDINSLKNKDKISVLILKTRIDKSKIFSFVVRLARKRRTKKMKIPEHVIKFLKEYE